MIKRAIDKAELKDNDHVLCIWQNDVTHYWFIRECVVKKFKDNIYGWHRICLNPSFGFGIAEICANSLEEAVIYNIALHPGERLLGVDYLGEEFTWVHWRDIHSSHFTVNEVIP